MKVASRIENITDVWQEDWKSAEVYTDFYSKTKSTQKMSFLFVIWF